MQRTKKRNIQTNKQTNKQKLFNTRHSTHFSQGITMLTVTTLRVEGKNKDVSQLFELVRKNNIQKKKALSNIV